MLHVLDNRKRLKVIFSTDGSIKVQDYTQKSTENGVCKPGVLDTLRIPLLRRLGRTVSMRPDWLATQPENERNKIMGYLKIVSKSRNKMWLGSTLLHRQVRSRLSELHQTSGTIYNFGFLNVLTNRKGSVGTAISPSMEILQDPKDHCQGRTHSGVKIISQALLETQFCLNLKALLYLRTHGFHLCGQRPGCPCWDLRALTSRVTARSSSGLALHSAPASTPPALKALRVVRLGWEKPWLWSVLMQASRSARPLSFLVRRPSACHWRPNSPPPL